MGNPYKADRPGASPFADWINLLFQASNAHSLTPPGTF